MSAEIFRNLEKIEDFFIGILQVHTGDFEIEKDLLEKSYVNIRGLFPSNVELIKEIPCKCLCYKCYWVEIEEDEKVSYYLCMCLDTVRLTEKETGIEKDFIMYEIGVYGSLAINEKLIPRYERFEILGMTEFIDEFCSIFRGYIHGITFEKFVNDFVDYLSNLSTNVITKITEFVQKWGVGPSFKYYAFVEEKFEVLGNEIASLGYDFLEIMYYEYEGNFGKVIKELVNVFEFVGKSFETKLVQYLIPPYYLRESASIYIEEERIYLSRIPTRINGFEVGTTTGMAIPINFNDEITAGLVITGSAEDQQLREKREWIGWVADVVRGMAILEFVMYVFEELEKKNVLNPNLLKDIVRTYLIWKKWVTEKPEKALEIWSQISSIFIEKEQGEIT